MEGYLKPSNESNREGKEKDCGDLDEYDRVLGRISTLESVQRKNCCSDPEPPPSQHGNLRPTFCTSLSSYINNGKCSKSPSHLISERSLCSPYKDPAQACKDVEDNNRASIQNRDMLDVPWRSVGSLLSRGM